MTKDRSFYKTFFILCGTLVLQNIIVLGVNLADNVMIGGYAEISLSGVAAVNQIQFILQQVVNGVGDVIVVLASQYWGQKRLEPIRSISAIGTKIALGIALVLFTLVSLFPEGTLRLFTNDPAVIAEGVRYLRIIRFTYPVFALTTALLATLRSVETVRIALIISISTLIINCSINYTLISGHFGAPELGVVGAAIGTLTARCVELVVVTCFLAFRDKKLHLRFRDLLGWNSALARDYLRVGLPVIITAGLWGASNALQTVILGHMSANAIAANSMSSTLYLTLKVGSVGAASAAAIIIGKTIGEDRGLAKIKEYSRSLQVLFLCIGAVMSLGLFFLRKPILSLYQLSDETRALANSFLLVLCVTGFGMSYQMPTLTGIIRGGGDTRFVLINDLISIWGIVLPVSALAAFVLHWSPVAVVCCLNADQVFKCGAACIHCNRYRWIKKLTN
ncbi:MAG: MATE family efflux transporter [Oscillospiraceae bacterium]|nr:MATE family efflux transporter [Oscillospiraceae bacterium]